jgi:hypothetical protein
LGGSCFISGLLIPLLWFCKLGGTYGLNSFFGYSLGTSLVIYLFSIFSVVSYSFSPILMSFLGSPFLCKKSNFLSPSFLLLTSTLYSLTGLAETSSLSSLISLGNLNSFCFVGSCRCSNLGYSLGSSSSESLK